MRGHALLLSLLLLPWAAWPAGAQFPPPGQDWVIDQDTFVSNETIWMDLNNITVKSGAILELYNVSLNFNATSQINGGIVVEADAALVMNGCLLNTGIDNEHETLLIVNGSADINDSLLKFTRWIFANGSRCNFTSSTFTNYRIQCENTELTISHCAVNQQGGLGGGYIPAQTIESTGSNLTIVDCSFNLTRSSSAFHILASGGEVTITDSGFYTGSVSQTYTYLKFSKVNFTVVNTTFGNISERDAAPPMHTADTGRDGPENFLLRGCTFRECDRGICGFNDNSGQLFIGIRVATGPDRKARVIGCSFLSLDIGILGPFPVAALVEGNSFTQPYDGLAIKLDRDGTTNSWMIRNNTFTEGEWIVVHDNDWVTVENNSMTRQNDILGPGISFS